MNANCTIMTVPSAHTRSPSWLAGLCAREQESMGCASSSNKDPGEPRGGSGGSGNGGDEEEYNPLTTEEVNARIQCCDKPLEHTLGKSGITLRYAYLSQRGYYPEDLYKANQDAFKVIPSFNGDPNNMFLGVFDGHGSDGDACSYFVRDNIEANLKRAIEKHPDDFEMAFKASFIETNDRMHQAVRTAPGSEG